MNLLQAKLAVTPETPRTLEMLESLFSQVVKELPDAGANLQKQRSIVCDTLIFYLTDHGWAGKLPFTYGEAYLALDIPREFLI